jgi:hypothetical protein
MSPIQRPSTWHERLRWRIRRDFKAIVLALVLAAVVAGAFQFGSVILRVFGGLLIMQGRYYQPKEEDRMRQLREKKIMEENAKKGQ